MTIAARTLALAALLLAGSARAARDPYAPLKPLVGAWLIDKDCVVNREKVLAVITSQPHSFHVEFFDPRRPGVRTGTGDIFSTTTPDHYRVSVQLPDNPILQTLGLKELPGTLVIADDGDEDNPGKNYLTCSLAVSVFNSQTTAKLRDRVRTATFIFKDETPLGKDQCRGTAVKQKAAPKALPTLTD
jgi:hypothetical protein